MILELLCDGCHEYFYSCNGSRVCDDCITNLAIWAAETETTLDWLPASFAGVPEVLDGR